MGIFDFLKTKKKAKPEEAPLPPPPSMQQATIEPEIPDITPEPPAFRAPEAGVPMSYEKAEKAEYYHKTELPENAEKGLAKREYYEKLENPEEHHTPEYPEIIKTATPVFDQAIHEEAEAPFAPSVRPTGPIFVATDDYRHVLDRANKARARLFEAEELVRRLGELKVQEEKQFEKWRSQLENIEKKLAYVDTVIAKAKT